MESDGEKPILKKEHVAAGVGLRRFVGILVVEPDVVSFEAPGLPTVKFDGGIRVCRTFFAPVGLSTDIELGVADGFGPEPLVLSMGWRAGSRVIRALEVAGLETAIRRRLL